ncbi:prepilin-type N-terminal cleavage/methylation domain-containing protein [Allochromatium humboldtianum]|uniref:Prepilin-type N-terminal cleavage/methylation domain-containing protein n=1 Tax=Allochromatium humboldtianum TaxID=504901 RepID=A0A850RBG6_9GAMM|nr:prepilin-type N-terminal cleavage/methylation domain-containing protein [Allochromatium humboldtianum]NVZ11334.1 prepilin-type N-terminal cleavage/methylation domain-containing protein [Allochromatium humboldtianum]
MPLLKSKISGFSLVEMMVGLAVGLIMLAGLISFFVVYNKTNFDLLKAIQLEQEMRATLDFISRDIRRVGYWDDAHEDIGDEDYCPLGYYSACPTGATPIPRFTITTGQILYSYDSDMDGAPEDYGFRRNGSVIEYLNTSWIPLTESSRTNYSTFTITPTVRSVALSGTTHLQIRELLVSLSANATGDPSISRNLIETIRIRNDEYVP